jgi:hypothetical protein
MDAADRLATEELGLVMPECCTVVEDLQMRVESSTAVLAPYRLISGPVAWWHVQLGAIALLNLVLWALSAAAVARGPVVNAACLMQLILSAVYMLGCAFRSVLPVYDIPRIVIVESRLSSVMVGRSVATVAELCFAIQWALILHRMALLSHSPFGDVASLAIVPLVIVAECCSWHAVLTTEQRGHMVENSLWGVAAALVVASLLVIGPHRHAEFYWPMLIWSIGGAAYAAFIFLLDVPMYWSRWLADRAAGRRYLSVAQGVADVCRRQVVSYRWEDWKSEMLWMSLYFSLGVWASISLVYASIALGAYSRF